MALLISLMPYRISAADLTPEQVAQYEQQRQQEAYQLQQDQLSKELTAKAESLTGKWLGECVIGVRKFLFGDASKGKEHIQGYVRTTINSYDPVVGSIIVISFGIRHGGTVLFSTATDVYYFDSNADGSFYGGRWHGTGRGAIRHIAINDKRIKGYHKIT